MDKIAQIVERLEQQRNEEALGQLQKQAFEAGFMSALEKVAETMPAEHWGFDVATQAFPFGSSLLGAVRGGEGNRLRPALEHAGLGVAGNIAGAIPGSALQLAAILSGKPRLAALSRGMTWGGAVAGGALSQRVAKRILEKRLAREALLQKLQKLV